ncbi:magnesium-dependent phosphatase 1 [Selaginella moellendorffii]|uniref:magnesium-dependent phosphatase 1 n=1 Tax=Selaginella moellendorffii TaxID=88036 RepID=UPI000D1C5933|nr:magnesium-dependent phosphatase 1 [Selaginella moellendorffii]|eukprot:XP_024545795.1 magnesium-dependent phosphatase 1 [Selaginella moellendorffii]
MLDLVLPHACAQRLAGPRAPARMSTSSDAVKAQALELLASAERLPRLVVFDLDYTLWPFWCECMSKRDNPRLYPQVTGILSALQEKGVAMAVASRTPTPDIATAFLSKLNLATLFFPKEIYPSWSHKTEHFQKIHQKSSTPFKDMLFFDDEQRNIKAVSQMGVTSILVDEGVNLEALRQGLKDYTKK